MPTNKLIYFGVIVIAASVLLWLGAELAKRVEWILPYTAGVGLLLMIVGMFIEMKKKKEGHVEVATPIESGGIRSSTVISPDRENSDQAT
jgi:hypothetical protein